jgi:dihydroorotate dehydrogenase (NAD+) catalytic subunit
VSVGTAIFGDPCAPVRVLAELRTALAERAFAAVADAVGYAHRGPDAQDFDTPAAGQESDTW